MVGWMGLGSNGREAGRGAAGPADRHHPERPVPAEGAAREPVPGPGKAPGAIPGGGAGPGPVPAPRPERIRVLVVEDAEPVRRSLVEMLEMEPDFHVVGEAADGEAAAAMAADLRPHVILMDINLPRLDGLAAAERILRQLDTRIIMVSVENGPEYFRRAMQAGACDFLVKPFSPDALAEAVRRAVPPAGEPALVTPQGGRGRLITVFSAKGGVGKSTLAVNLAVALAKRPDRRTVLVDLDLELGSAAMLLGIRPRATLADLCRREGALDPQAVAPALHPVSGFRLSLLPAPLFPHEAAEIEGEGRRDPARNYTAEVLEALRSTHDFVVVDTAANYRDSNLTAFDMSDLLVVVTTSDIPAVANTAKCLDLLIQKLEYPEEKVRVVLNLHEPSGLTPDEVAHGLNFPVAHVLPRDPVAVQAANAGVPFCARRTRSPLGDAVEGLAEKLAPSGPGAPVRPAGRRLSLLGLF
ncbi:response regulator [Thermaerobacter subterraneus]|uniref:Stage 0 sporulation protein A homolog n=1 Tax=Thermaerobacter subterraneus DSM 13965 TaxID=867903 RepID=K6PYH7_9FIRM|nr:response regulator [Thermaerobacter subterraneus]EKP93793.1 ATPase involved in chromosome partitioning [Thermaerobacter subterraneus DSM 13965]